jgi:hypothetical protein
MFAGALSDFQSWCRHIHIGQSAVQWSMIMLAV